MSVYKNYFYNNNYLSETVGYSIIISISEFMEASNLIDQNTSIVPEFIGKLIGRAIPNYRRVACKVCDKHIKKPEAMEMEITKNLEAVHKECYEKYKNGDL